MPLQKKLKVALLFSGQVRPISAATFNLGLKEFTRNLDVDVYLTHWDEPGVSMGHNLSKISQATQLDFEIDSYLKEAFDGFKVVAHESEAGDDWRLALAPEYADILSSDSYSRLTIHSLPQLYQIYKSFQLVEDQFDHYDVVMRCRYDLLFVTSFRDWDYEEGVVNGLNFGRAYHPDRIYDIFFWGPPSAVRSALTVWRDLPQLIDDQFDNGLDQRDACRLLYLGARQGPSVVKSGLVRYCDIYRPEKSVYEYYVNILYWALIEKSVLPIVKQEVFRDFYSQSTKQIGFMKTQWLRFLTGLGIYKRGTLAYWKKKFFKIFRVL
jgi:hypothetical protein